MAKAISSSLAFTIRLRVAMAVPPQMQVPPPTRMEVFSDTFRAFRPTSRAMVKDSRMANALCKGISEQIVCGWKAYLFRQPCRMKNRKYIQYSPV